MFSTLLTARTSICGAFGGVVPTALCWDGRCCATTGSRSLDTTAHEKGGVADIVAEAGAQVWGALYDIDESCLRALDEYEGAPRAYRRETLRVADDRGVEHEAIAYVANKTGTFAPSRAYLAQITRGARDHELPDEYVKSIEETRTCTGKRHGPRAWREARIGDRGVQGLLGMAAQHDGRLRQRRAGGQMGLHAWSALRAVQ